MNLGLIRDIASKKPGGIRGLASKMGMSESNLHRCINNNSMKVQDLETLAILLDTDVRQFFDTRAVKYKKGTDSSDEFNNQLLLLCKTLADNYKQRDNLMAQLVALVKDV